MRVTRSLPRNASDTSRPLHGLFLVVVPSYLLLFTIGEGGGGGSLARSHARTDHNNFQLVGEFPFLICTFDFVLEHLSGE